MLNMAGAQRKLLVSFGIKISNGSISFGETIKYCFEWCELRQFKTVLDLITSLCAIERYLNSALNNMTTRRSMIRKIASKLKKKWVMNNNSFSRLRWWAAIAACLHFCTFTTFAVNKKAGIFRSFMMAQMHYQGPKSKPIGSRMLSCKKRLQKVGGYLQTFSGKQVLTWRIKTLYVLWPTWFSSFD